MAKMIDFNSLLTKLSNVFRLDMYIYRYQFCIGGNYSEMDNEGKILCTLNPEYMEMIKELYPNKEYIYFSDIKKAKKEPEKYIEIVSDEFTKKLIEKHYASLKNNIEKDGKWNELILSEEDVQDIFFDRNLHTLFKDNKDIPSLEVAKSLFPLLSEKNVLDTEIQYKSYGQSEEDEVASIVFSYSTEWFKIDEFLMYFELS